MSESSLLGIREGAVPQYDRARIYRMLDAGVRNADIAREVGCTPALISQIKHGITAAYAGRTLEELIQARAWHQRRIKERTAMVRRHRETLRRQREHIEKQHRHIAGHRERVALIDITLKRRGYGEEEAG